MLQQLRFSGWNKKWQPSFWYMVPKWVQLDRQMPAFQFGATLTTQLHMDRMKGLGQMMYMGTKFGGLVVHGNHQEEVARVRKILL